MKSWKSILFTALSALFLWLFFRRVDLAAVGAVWATVPLRYPLLFALLFLPQYALRALRWGVLLRPFKRRIPFRSLWNYSLIGFMITYLLPGRLGEIARPALLAEKEGIKKSQAFATIVNERLFDLLSVLLLLLLYLAVGGAAPSPLLRQLRQAALLLVPLVLAAFLLIALANAPAFYPRTERLAGGLCRLLPRRWRPTAQSFLLSFVRALRLDLKRRDAAAVAAYSLLHWGLIGFSYWLLLRGFGVRCSLPAVAPFLAVVFVSAAVPTPGMAGSLDLAVAYALTALYAMPGPAAAGFTILFHFLLLLPPIALGLVALWHEGLSFAAFGRLKRNDELPTVH